MKDPSPKASLKMSNRSKFRDAVLDIKRIISETKDPNNIQRRIWYSQLEILKIDIETSSSPDLYIDTIAEIDSLVSTLNLIPVPNPQTIIKKIETATRFVGVCCSIVTCGTFCSLPLLLLRALDETLQADPFSSISESFKRGIAWTMLFQSGIEVEVQGLDLDYFKDSCALMTFAHASNLDGFVVSGTCPIKQLAFGKKELFLVPFFSWLSLAFGGVPVDRNHRERAVSALKRSVDSAKRSKVCIAIAPEGTRSTTGQLNVFKKGR